MQSTQVWREVDCHSCNIVYFRGFLEGTSDNISHMFVKKRKTAQFFQRAEGVHTAGYRSAYPLECQRMVREEHVVFIKGLLKSKTVK